ncbi:MAG: hypothetical protein ACR2I5_08545 [Candidatus Limnocylindria bacterium]
MTLQPLLFDAFFTLCLASAVVNVVMTGPAMDEGLASLQYVRGMQRGGGSTWRAFWIGEG